MWEVDGKTYYTDSEIIQKYCRKHDCCESCHKRIRLWCRIRSWYEKRIANYIETLSNKEGQVQVRQRPPLKEGQA